MTQRWRGPGRVARAVHRHCGGTMGNARARGFEPHSEFVRWLVDWVELDWDDELVSGDEHIDRQHKELFELSGRLVEARDGTMPPDELRAAIASLREHATAHFADEEELLRRYDVPRAEQHILGHEEFRGLIERCERAAVDARGDALVPMLDELEAWIRGHVRNEDREALAFLRAADA